MDGVAQDLQELPKQHLNRQKLSYIFANRWQDSQLAERVRKARDHNI